MTDRGTARPRITVVGLGPAGPELLTGEAAELLRSDQRIYLRTARHPAADAVDATATYDHVYDAAESFDEVYEQIVEDLVERAREAGEVIYAVPGSPAVAERTVELLRRRTDIELDIRSSLSFTDLAWVALGIDPMAEAVTVVDGHEFGIAAGGGNGPFLVTQVHSAEVLGDVVVALDHAAVGLTLLQRLGSPDQRVEQITPERALRESQLDHLTSLYIERLDTPVAPAFQRFDELVRRLRVECPWDRVQTHESLRKHLIEETYEVLEAIDAVAADPDVGYEHLEEELGDLLFQVFIHARLAAEEGRFTVADVATGIHDKLHLRHPHVFGDADPDEAVSGWELAKQTEKDRASLLDGIPGSLPALLTALKVQKRAAATGFTGPDLPWAIDDVRGELAELVADPTEHELGDLLFAAVQVARMLDVDPEHALAQATTRFAGRFREVERLAAGRDIALSAATIETLETLWAEAKSLE